MTTRVFIIIVLTVLISLRVGYQLGAVHGRGYIGCKDGKLTMENFLIDSVKSEAFHFGNDPCNGEGAAITIGDPEKKP